jgi:hypothetical protein
MIAKMSDPSGKAGAEAKIKSPSVIRLIEKVE